jgi:hypothetical protein
MKISKLGVTILSIAIIGLTGCSKGSISKSSAANSATREDPLVLTPFGYKLQSHVHYLPPDHDLTEASGRLLEIDHASKRVINDFGEVSVRQSLSHDSMRSTGNNVDVRGIVVPKTNLSSPTDNGWVTFAQWHNTTGTPIKSFVTDWVVPPAPTTNHGQTIYLFNALEDGLGVFDATDTQHIIQPVLQWGPSNAGGGALWTITNWYGPGPTGNYFYGDLDTVAVGTGLQGVITFVGQNGNAYDYNSSFTGFPANSQYTMLNVPEMNWTYETLEVYNVQSSTDYPTATAAYPLLDVPMNNIQLTLTTGANAPLNWTKYNLLTEYGQQTVIATNGSPNGAVDIYYGTLPGLTGTSTYNSNNQTGSGTITAKSGTIVNVQAYSGGSIAGPPNYITAITIPGALSPAGSYTLNSSGQMVVTASFASSGEVEASFVMPASGSVTYSGIFTERPPYIGNGGFLVY